MGNFTGPMAMPIIERSMASQASSQRTLASTQSRRVSSSQGCRGFSASRAGAARTAAILLLSLNPADSEVPNITQTCSGIGVLI